jgi:hypothetical protein
MLSQKVVIPAKAGIQGGCNSLKFLDSRLCGNDKKVSFPTFFRKQQHYFQSGPAAAIEGREDGISAYKDSGR